MTHGSRTAEPPAVAPIRWSAAFRIESYRFQWVSDLLTSWAFEMEILILAWYVLTQTDSPFLTAAVASLSYGGTLLSPMVGVVADRTNRKRLLLGLRFGYAVLAFCIAILAIGEWLQTWQVFVIAAVSGLIRPSDLVIRNAIIADTVPGPELANAMGFSRTTMDSARIIGALVGAGLFAWVGIGVAYLGVTMLYLLGLIVGWGIHTTRGTSIGRGAWRELGLGARYVVRTPIIAHLMLLAFVVNLFAFPLSHGLLPVMARDVFHVDELGLAQLTAAYAVGALVGSVLIASVFRARDPKSLTLGGMVAWLGLLVVFTRVPNAQWALAVLFFVGAAQSLSMTSMSVYLLSITRLEFRGRVLGVRMLAVYGLPIGLLVGGWMLEAIGVRTALTLFAVMGLITVVAAIWFGRRRYYGHPEHDRATSLT
ncbi:MAG: MFS transporter [Gammaproteobacteria bacterium]|nr:MFS transporter [Gammaproteobacteria bacterium]